MIRLDGDVDGDGPICLVVTGNHTAREIERATPAGFRPADDGQRLADKSGWFYNLEKVYVS